MFTSRNLARIFRSFPAFVTSANESLSY
jgi:hypothetical protein